MFDFLRSGSILAKLAALHATLHDWRSGHAGLLQDIKLDLTELRSTTRTTLSQVQALVARMDELELAAHEAGARAATPHDQTDRLPAASAHAFIDPDKHGDDPTPDAYRD